MLSYLDILYAKMKHEEKIKQAEQERLAARSRLERGNTQQRALSLLDAAARAMIGRVTARRAGGR